MRSPWTRIIRGTLAATLLVLGTGGLPHHHADHDGNLVHLDEEHGSHDVLTRSTDVRVPAAIPFELATGLLVTQRSPGFAAPVARMAARPSPVMRPVGPDPPALLGARAPPPTSL